MAQDSPEVCHIFCRCNGDDAVKAAEWYYQHLVGGMPIIVLQGGLDPSTMVKAANPAEGKPPGLSMKASGDDLLDELLNLEISPAQQPVSPDPIASANASARKVIIAKNNLPSL